MVGGLCLLQFQTPASHSPGVRVSGSRAGSLATPESCLEGNLLGQAMELLKYCLPSFYRLGKWLKTGGIFKKPSPTPFETTER